MLSVMKVRYASAMAAAVVLVLGAAGYFAYKRVIPTVRPSSVLLGNTVQSEAGQPNVTWSQYGEQSLSIVGKSLSASYGPETALPTASVAKVMTTLAILQKYPLSVGEQGPTITITAADVSEYQAELGQDQSVVQVSAGEQLTEYQALQEMLIASASNVATLMATWAFGSLDNYLSFANQYAAQLGLSHTHLADASGFLPETVSTPQDLVTLGEAAVSNPVIAQIVAQPSADVPVAGMIQNVNTDLGIAGISGIKTGNTDQAGGVLLFSAPYQGQTIVGVLMGSPNLGTALHDSPEVLKSFESNIQSPVTVTAGQSVAEYALPWGGTIDAVAAQNIQFLQWPNAKVAIQVKVNAIKSDSKAGDVVGTITATYQGETQKTNVILKQTPETPGLRWRLFH